MQKLLSKTQGILISLFYLVNPKLQDQPCTRQSTFLRLARRLLVISPPESFHRGAVKESGGGSKRDWDLEASGGT